MFEAHVNRASIESDGQRTSRLKNRYVRRTANADLASFYKIDTRRSGLYPHVTAAAQYGFHLAVHDFHAHRSGDGDSFAVDDADRVGRWLVRSRSAGGD